jgi:hypothetical protein
MAALSRVWAFVLVVLSWSALLLCAPLAGAAGWRVAATRISGPVGLVSGCGTTDANTPQIAVDPTDARHLAATYAVGTGSASVLAVSHDGGKTWKRSPLRGTLSCDGGGGSFLNRFDPDLEFDPWGRLYVSESVENFLNSGTSGIDVYSLTVAPGSDTLGPAVPIVGANPLIGAQRGFFAFDPAAPGAADMLTERIKFVSGQYKLADSSLQLARTVNAGVSYTTTTVYSPPPTKLVVAEGLIRHGQESLAFAEQDPTVGHFPISDSLIMLRSSDGGLSWSAPQTVFNHTVQNKISDCCLLRPVSAPDRTIYIPDPNGGTLKLVRSTDEGGTWQRLRIGKFGDVSEPVVAAGPAGRVAVAFYKITNTTSGQDAAVRIAVSRNHGLSWSVLRLGRPFSIRRLGPTTDTSPLGPVQGIAATPTGFVAAMTVGGSLVHAGTGSAVDLVSITSQ